MKVHTDFITNSSSTSFIFGRPGEISGLSKNDIGIAIQCLYHNIQNASAYINNKLKEKDKRAYDSVIKARHYYEVYESNKMSLGDNTVIAFYDKAQSIHEQVTYNEIYQNILRKAYDTYLAKVVKDWDNFRFYFSKYFIMEYNTTALQKQINDIKNHLYDLKDTKVGNETSLIDMLHFHKWKDSVDKLQKDTIEHEFWYNQKFEVAELNKIAFNQLGEYAIYGIDDLDICEVLIMCMQGMSN